jgi:intracellular multiplication protein IcmE
MVENSSPTGRRGSAILAAFQGPRGAFARRAALISLGVLTVLGFGAQRVFSHKQLPPVTNVASIPPINAEPGGANATPYYKSIDSQASLAQAQTAESNGDSSTTPFPPSDPVAEPTPVIPAPAPLKPVPQATSMAYHPQPLQGNPATPLNNAQVAAYQNSINALLASFSGGPPSTYVLVKPDPAPIAPSASAIAGPPASAAVGVATDPAPTPGPAALQNAVLVPAGNGVYARTIVGVSSDQPGPIVAVAESGPIAGDRMIGSFSEENSKLVVHLTSITLADGSQEPIDAVMVAPDTMETAVASGVDEHYFTRFALPIAAAFVEGLGQAIQQSNSTIVQSPLGGVTAYNKLNLGQEMGIAAGTAGGTAAGLIDQAVPHGPTITLAAGVDVGVLFLSPLKEAASTSP